MGPMGTEETALGLEGWVLTLLASPAPLAFLRSLLSKSPSLDIAFLPPEILPLTSALPVVWQAFLILQASV